MSFQISKVEVWAGDIPDKPGGLAQALSGLSESGANLECLIARRESSKPGTGVVFLTPVKGAKSQKAARAAGLSPAQKVATLRGVR